MQIIINECHTPDSSVTKHPTNNKLNAVCNAILNQIDSPEIALQTKFTPELTNNQINGGE